MRLLENLCCFILFFAEVGDSPGRPSGQCQQGVTWGWLVQGSGPRELFVCGPALGPVELCEIYMHIWV